MKVIEKAPAQPQNSSQMNDMLENFQQALGMSKQTDRQAEDKLVNHFKMLPSPYTLLRNIQLEGQSEVIPLILIGPSGIYLIVASSAKGVFQAKEDDWMEMRNDKREFGPSKPNLISQAVRLTRLVEAFIQEQGYEAPELQTVLYFANPGTHVDAVRPAARIVLADGLDRLMSAIASGEKVFSNEDVLTLVGLFTRRPETPESEPAFTEEVLEVVEEMPPPAPRQESELMRRITEYAGKLPFSRSQWMVLGGMLVAEILILVMLFFVILVFYF